MKAGPKVSAMEKKRWEKNRCVGPARLTKNGVL